MLSKRILTLQDLSCVGQCSLTVALPVLSAYGIETCVLPTAVLSNHTALPRWSNLDMTDEIPNIFAVWRELGYRFDAFLLGYLGNRRLMDIAKECFRDFSMPGAKVILDPVCGDNGRLYPAFDNNYVKAMAELICSADILLPNLTEACFLTGTPYRENPDETFCRALLARLSDKTDATIVMTGIERGDEIGELIYDKGSVEEIFCRRFPGRYHGTGDLFASAFSAVLLRGGDLAAACREAGEFIYDSIAATEPEHSYGVNFEYALAHRRLPDSF